MSAEYIHLPDTVYGCQDREDDIKVGVWSSALFFGDNVWIACVALDASFITCLYFAGVENGHGLSYFAISVGGSALQLLYQLAILDTRSTASCWGAWIVSAYRCYLPCLTDFSR